MTDATDAKLKALTSLPAADLEQCLGSAVRSGDCPVCGGYFHCVATAVGVDDYACESCGLECSRGRDYWAI